MTQDTRPPVGSTGTLAELQVGPGDVVQYIPLGAITTVRHINGGKFYGDGDFPSHPYAQSEDFRLISRAQPQPTQTVTTNGRHYDLYTLETPFGLLPEPVQAALQAWPHGVLRFYCAGEWRENFKIWSAEFTYRAKPAPVETRVMCYRGAMPDVDELGTCIKRPDGSIDWDTWEPSE